METIKKILRRWFPLAVAVTGVCGLVYLAVQQELRQTANDPQIQIAEDGAAALEKGASPESVLPSEAVDVQSSLSPFVMVFNDRGETLASSALLHERTPQLPPGVLDYVRAHGADRVTWQPEEGVRIAAVILRYQGASPGVILAGRSLREVEMREDQVLWEAVAAWIVTSGASLAAVALGELFLTERRVKPSAG
jgi:hypothetical protein